MVVWKFSNFQSSYLESTLVLGGTVLSIPQDDSLLLPTPLGVDEQFPLTVWDGQNPPEIVYVTSNPGNGQLDVLRGQEGSNEREWPAGSEVRLALTKAILEESFLAYGPLLTSLTELDADVAGVVADLAGKSDVGHTHVLADITDFSVASIVPPGSIIGYAGSVIPTGWLLCYGQAVSRTTYAALFAAIGTTHGAGDGTTTFNLPDARDRSLLGRGNMGGVAAGIITVAGSGLNSSTLGAKGGSEKHILTSTQLPIHNHSIALGAGGDHTHSVSGTVSGLSGLAGGHNHLYFHTKGSLQWWAVPPTFQHSAYTNLLNSEYDGPGEVASEQVVTTAVAHHQHSFSGSISSGLAALGGSHIHTATIGNTGTGASHPNLSPVIVTEMIIKY